MALHAGVVAPAAEPDFDGAESEPAAGFFDCWLCPGCPDPED